MSGREVHIFRETGEMIGFMAAQWIDIARDAIGRRGHFTAALSGGKTPRDFFLSLAHLVDRELWRSTHIFLVDERCVPLDSPDSNYALIRSSLLSKVSIPAENVHPVPVDPDDPTASARKYEEELKFFFRLNAGLLPDFDFIHLGIGADGHTASLFPGSGALDEKERLCVHAIQDEARHSRVTLTLPVINNASNIIMLVSGRDKAGIVKRVITGRDDSLPASRVSPRGNLLFLLDREAASELKDICRQVR